MEQPALCCACSPNRRDAWIPNICSILHKIKVGTLPNSFYEDSITLIQSQTKRQENKTTGQSPSCTHLKTFTQILANPTQRHVEKVACRGQVGFTVARKDGSAYANQSVRYTTFTKGKEKTHTIISTETEKTFDKLQHPFKIKTQQDRYRRSLPRHNKYQT